MWNYSSELPLRDVQQAGRRHDPRGGRQQLRGRVPVAGVRRQQRPHRRRALVREHAIQHHHHANTVKQ